MRSVNMQKGIRWLLIIVLAVVAVSFICRCCDLYDHGKKIPSVANGTAVRFAAEMSDLELVSCVDASEESIFVSYASRGVVAVYDWSGKYRYSLAFFSNTNGSLSMRCEDNLLYVSDHENYEFIFAEDTQLEVMSPSEAVHSKGWYHETREQPVEIRQDKIYDKMGNYIMEVPGNADKSANLYLISVLLLLSALYIFIKNTSRLRRSNV